MASFTVQIRFCYRKYDSEFTATWFCARWSRVCLVRRSVSLRYCQMLKGLQIVNFRTTSDSCLEGIKTSIVLGPHPIGLIRTQWYLH